MEADVRESDYPQRRRPWVAVLLSLLLPGLGQVYCGAIVNGMVIMLIVVFFPSVWFVAMAHENTPPISFSFVLWGIVLLATVIAATDAYRRARRTRFDYQLKDYNCWEIYVFLIFFSGAGWIGFATLFKMTMLEAFSVPNYNMAPTVMAGDRLTVNKLVYRHGKPGRGDVVLYKNPKNLMENQIKRIVALGGDTVEIKQGRLYINGQALKREQVEKMTLYIGRQQITGDIYWENNGDARYRIFVSSTESKLTKHAPDFGPMTVPDYHCFVLGDNRDYTQDSRNYGTISIGAIRGKFQAIYWPYQRHALLGTQP